MDILENYSNIIYVSTYAIGENNFYFDWVFYLTANN